ncbi:MAG: hypothetical protein IPK78_16210 [Rhodospirillales bacterium]|nr:hypothetical protein [Rhodospirillales bacterium]
MLIEFLEELIPRDLFEAWRWLGKIDAENSGIVSRAGAGDGSRPSTARLDPLGDGFVIRGLV